jgi:dihydrofolate synthase / folylpolyglutamate synthase
MSSTKYQQTIQALFALQNSGVKKGAENILAIMEELGRPDKEMRIVHIAGSLGKGSTAAMISAALHGCGIDTGLFTSPHLVNFEERIRFNEQEINRRDTVCLATEVGQAIEAINQNRSDSEKIKPTFFEYVLAMAFVHFREKGAAYAIIEAGIGGKSDSTCFLSPEISIITAISLEHTEILGTDLLSIAREKGGIIKSGKPAVFGIRRPQLVDYYRKLAREKSSAASFIDTDFELVRKNGSCRYRGNNWQIENIEPPLAGAHQRDNLALSLRTLEILADSDQRITRLQVSDTVSHTYWPGRMQLWSARPDILLDGAHTPEAASALANALREKKEVGKQVGKTILLAGVMQDKNCRGIFTELVDLFDCAVAFRPKIWRSMPQKQLAGHLTEIGYQVRRRKDPNKALRLARELAGKDGLIVVTGSLFAVGDILALLEREKKRE